MKKQSLLLPVIITVIFAGSFFKAYPVIHVITAQDHFFSPDTNVLVRPGDTVRWIWVNGFHTTTSRTIPAGATAWNNLLDSDHLTFDYIPTIPGDYHYRCNNHYTMGMVGVFTVLNVTGVQETSEMVNITVTPNPFVDQVTLQTNLPEGTFLKGLNVFDMSGKIIKETSFGLSGGFPYNLNLPDLPTGVLLFECTDNFNRKYSIRVVHRN